MSRLERQDWQIHVIAEEPVNGEPRYRIVSNTFKLFELTFDELTYAVTPFIGCSGKLHIHIHESIGSEKERERIYMHLADLMNSQSRAKGFLTPAHPALASYWYNILNKREKFHAHALKDRFKGKRLLFCGAGPSLEKNAETIKKIIDEDRALVVTGGTGIKIMHDLGIVPHLCLAVDPFDHERERLLGLDPEWCKKTVLLASTALNPQCFDKWPGPLMAADGLNAMDVGKFVEGEYEAIDEGGVGVSTMMTDLARYLGISEVHLVGCDLCFGEDGRTYSNDEDMICADYVARTVEGKETKQNWIQESIDIGERLRERNIKIFNSSGGLNIPGSTIQSLDKLLKRSAQDNKFDLIPWTKYRKERIVKKVKEIRDNLEYLTENLFDETIFEQIGYKYLLKQYDDVQEYQFWRSGSYNYSLMREVCRTNVELIDEALEGKVLEHQLRSGFKGSPKAGGTDDRLTRTGSKHKKEAKDA
jgi:hypothetical protein